MSCPYKPDCKNEKAMRYLEALVWGVMRECSISQDAQELVEEIQTWLLEQEKK